MSFRILATPEPLLKKGHFVQFIGDWGDKYEYTVGGQKFNFYQVTNLIQFERSYREGYAAAALTAAVQIDPDADMGFEPVYNDTIYQVRHGLSHGWNMYLKWPTGDYRGKLEDPVFTVINPVATDDKKFIGVISSGSPAFGTAAGKMTSLVDATLTTGPTVPYDQVLWLNRIEISNHVLTDVRIIGYDTFTDTGGVARTEMIFDYTLVAGQTVGVDVEKSKKCLGVLKFQAIEGVPTAGNPVRIYVGGQLEAPKLDRFFEFVYVKDWMPLFEASVNSLLDYEKIVLSCLVNKLKIKAVNNPTLLQQLKSGILPSYPLYHYSEYETRQM